MTLAFAFVAACGAPRTTPREPADEPSFTVDEPPPAPAPSAREAVDFVPPVNLVEVPSPTYRGTLDAAEVGARIHNDHARFRACGLHGSAVVRAVVETNGHVRSAAFTRESLTGGDKECLLRAVKATVFPPPDDTAEVILPFVFRSRQ